MGETLEMWPAGATFLFDILIANEAAAGAGNIELIYTAGEGTEFEVLYGSIFNEDTVARTGRAIIDDGTNLIVEVAQRASIANGTYRGYPSAQVSVDNGPSAAGVRFLVSGPMRLRLVVESVADGQDARFTGVLRIKGQPP